ncbi:hypothetical protein P4234_17060 [Pseudomonas aeruginosa]|nr:hypothetical protein [Pseudomonas aeruginosa]
MAFGNADVGSVHCISEAIGGHVRHGHRRGRRDLPPFVFGHNRDADITRHAQVAYARVCRPQPLSGRGRRGRAVGYLFQMSRTWASPASPR